MNPTETLLLYVEGARHGAGSKRRNNVGVDLDVDMDFDGDLDVDGVATVDDS